MLNGEDEPCCLWYNRPKRVPGETITANRPVVTRQLHMESFVRKEVLLLDAYLFRVHQNFQIRNVTEAIFGPKQAAATNPEF